MGLPGLDLGNRDGLGASVERRERGLLVVDALTRLRDVTRRGVKHLALVEIYRSRLGKDPVDGVRFHGVSVSFAKDSSVGLGAP